MIFLDWFKSRQKIIKEKSELQARLISTKKEVVRLKTMNRIIMSKLKIQNDKSK